MARCEHPTHHINWGTYSWRTETGKITWEIVFNDGHAPVVFCLDVLNRLGENCLQSFLVIGWCAEMACSLQHDVEIQTVPQILVFQSKLSDDISLFDVFHLSFSFVYLIFVKVDRMKIFANYMQKLIRFVLKF